MADVATLPKDPERNSVSLSSADEKHADEKNVAFNEKHPVDDVFDQINGDVYDDVRAIDLDENGKEKPIGEHFPVDYPTPSGSQPFLQSRMSTLLLG
jgi:hypothetical protein